MTRSIMPDFSPVDYAIPAFVLVVLAEMLWAWKRRPEAYEPKDTLTSLAFGLGSTVAGVLFGGLILAAARRSASFHDDPGGDPGGPNRR